MKNASALLSILKEYSSKGSLNDIVARIAFVVVDILKIVSELPMMNSYNTPCSEIFYLP